MKLSRALYPLVLAVVILGRIRIGLATSLRQSRRRDDGQTTQENWLMRKMLQLALVRSALLVLKRGWKLAALIGVAGDRDETQE